MFEHDATTFEVGQARLRLRDGLRFTLHQDAKRPWYLVEDEVTGQYFRIGLPEYTLMSVLDGKKSLATAVAETSALLGGQAFGERESAYLCRWVIESGLAETDASRAASRVTEKYEKETRQKRLQWLNPISLKFPLFNPDSMISSLERAVGWLVSVPLGIAWIVVVSIAAFLMWVNWDLMVVNRIQSFGGQDLIWIVVAWVVLKGLHETSHALVCKRFGGEVPQFGMLLLLMIPMPFVDVTSSWRFANKYARILTAAAGMIVELLIAAIAVFVWVNADPGPIRYHAENVIFVATIGTILFNANPLMRFDGYYMLADWLEIPNLYQHGRQYVKGLFKWTYLGSPLPTLVESGSRAQTIKLYGFASTLWFFVITFSLMVGACSLLEGFGLLLAIVGAVIWFGIPAYQFAKSLFDAEQAAMIDRRRLVIAASLTACGLFLVGWLTPAPSVFTAPVVIDYKAFAEIRSRVPGFVKEFCVREGESVRAGQVVAILEDLDLRLDFDSAKISVRETKLRALARQNEGNIAAWQIEQETVEALEQRVDELGKMMDALTVRSPQDGVVLSSDIDARSGSYIRSGELILEIGNPDEKQAIALLRQSDCKWLKSKRTSHADLAIDGLYRESHSGTVDTIQPRTQDHVPHAAFAASMGGALSVIDRAQVDDSQSVASGMVKGSQQAKNRGVDGQVIGGRSQQYGNLKLVQPRVRVDLELDPESSRQLASGQTGVAYFRDRSQSLGTYLLTNTYQWFRRNITKSHGI